MFFLLNTTLNFIFNSNKINFKYFRYSYFYFLKNQFNSFVLGREIDCSMIENEGKIQNSHQVEDMKTDHEKLDRGNISSRVIIAVRYNGKCTMTRIWNGIQTIW